MNSRTYPKKVFKREVEKYKSQARDAFDLVKKIMEGKPVRVLELPRKQIVP